MISLNRLSEPRLQMSLAQLEETANLIQSAYPQLTAADICLFIARLKIGNYGPFYGSIDPMKIMAFLRQYANEHQRAKLPVFHPVDFPISLPDERQPVTYETYLETVRKAKAGDPEAIRELTPPPGKQ